MQVTVRLFAGLRERAGVARRELDLPAGATVADVWPALGLGDEPAGLRYSVNRSFEERGTALGDGDEVGLIPPVSGGAFALHDDAVSLDAVVAEVASPEAGAIATFTRTVRSNARGRQVQYLDYEAYEGMAEQMMAELAESLKAKYEIEAVAIHHRVGRVEIGEPSVVIAVSGAHRADALAACKEAIDTL